MERFLPRIVEILEADKRAPKKQRHTAKRVFDRLVEEHAFDGCCYSSVKEAVRAWRQGRQEVFLPLLHPPGEAQVDFGFAEVDLAGERTQVALFVMTLPYSDAVFVQAFPRECTEAFQEGRRRAFEFFGGGRELHYSGAVHAPASVQVELVNKAETSYEYGDCHYSNAG
jgi:transposase